MSFERVYEGVFQVVYPFIQSVSRCIGVVLVVTARKSYIYTYNRNYIMAPKAMV